MEDQIREYTMDEVQDILKVRQNSLVQPMLNMHFIHGQIPLRTKYSLVLWKASISSASSEKVNDESISFGATTEYNLMKKRCH